MRIRAPKIKKIAPRAGIEGGKILIQGADFNPEESSNTQVTFGGVAARVLLISSSRIITQIPEDAQPGPVQIQVKSKSSNAYDFILGQKLSESVNPADNPVFDGQGNLYVAYSGKRGEEVPVSIFKISPDGEVKPYLSNIPNPTSMALDQEGNLYISSRFEGTVYKATPKADVTVFAKDLGIPTGLVFDQQGFLFVGDRTGRILKISLQGEVSVFAEIPESLVAFHLAFDHDGNLLVANPGVSSHNSILMVDHFGKSIPLFGGFGRPQGLAVDRVGNIYVCEAKAGDSAIFKISIKGELSTLIAGPIMVGLAFDGQGNVLVATQNAVYKVPLGINGSKI